VSIAFGIASAENRDQLAEALKLSDERMYRDKRRRGKLPTLGTVQLVNAGSDLLANNLTGYSCERPFAGQNCRQLAP